MTKRDREILNCLVEAWDRSPIMPGDMNYDEVMKCLARLGLNEPKRLQKYLHEIDGLKHRNVIYPHD